MRYVGTLLQGQATDYVYLDHTLLVRPDPTGAAQFMQTEGQTIPSTITIDGTPTTYQGETAIYVDSLYNTFEGTLVNAADAGHSIQALLIHPRPAGSRGATPAGAQPAAGGGPKRRGRKG
jgi:hypothetical protein